MDVGKDAFHHAQIRKSLAVSTPSAQPGKKEASDKMVLTVNDLQAALAERNITLDHPDFFL